MPSREPCWCWRCPDSPRGESLPSLFAPGGAPVRHVPSAGVSRQAPRPISNAAGTQELAHPAGTFSRSLRAGTTPPWNGRRRV
ncbi:hypothetical protein NDU88_005106 [Pleurodeles waltl]|uniref:Uncharacterized protein n=1 Tax=Pleurodeles waltl TaxID=8319 RepID=A0AAV7VLT7_PLEWA|nr:hypothetical protein NDU88_005106 [Pleurodeles waltl]